jgi:uncharacterized membrane protein
MPGKREQWTLATTGIVTALTALAAVATTVIRIPIPATTGYFNIGDAFVLLAALWLGPRAGLIVGFVGPTVADAIGFPQFMLATAITKGAEGLIAGLIGGGRAVTSAGRKTLASIVGGATMVTGYFVFEALIYPWLSKYAKLFAVTDLGAAVVELGPNGIQAFVGASVALALWRAVSSAAPSASPTIVERDAQ